MAYRLRVSDRAIQEIGEAYEWYEEQLHGLGVEFIDALDVLFPEIRRGIRRTLLSHFPYGVFYASKGDVVSVLAVVHTARNPRCWPRQP